MGELENMARKADAARQSASDAMMFEERAIAGVAMFDLLAESLRAGFRLQRPGATDDEVEQLLVEHLRLMRARERQDVPPDLRPCSLQSA